MRPFAIESLWDMLRVDTDEIFPPLSHLLGALSEWRLLMQMPHVVAQRPVPEDKAIGYLRSIQILKDVAQKLDLPATHQIIENEYQVIEDIVIARIPLDTYKMQKLSAFSEKIYSVFVAETRSISLMCLPRGHSTFLSPEGPIFGDLVDDAFPAASQEIADAGRCRAAGMWTAVVMHLMRALEDALTALARYVEAEPGQNWNSTLDRIDAALKRRTKREFGEDEEQWAAEASAHLRNIKNAWRNHAQHGRARYNEVEAVAIWNNVQALLQTLASKLLTQASE